MNKDIVYTNGMNEWMNELKTKMKKIYNNKIKLHKHNVCHARLPAIKYYISISLFHVLLKCRIYVMNEHLKLSPFTAQHSRT